MENAVFYLIWLHYIHKWNRNFHPQRTLGSTTVIHSAVRLKGWHSNMQSAHHIMQIFRFYCGMGLLAPSHSDIGKTWSRIVYSRINSLWYYSATDIPVRYLLCDCDATKVKQIWILNSKESCIFLYYCYFFIKHVPISFHNSVMDCKK